jgi:predicted nucleotidyltransferase
MLARLLLQPDSSATFADLQAASGMSTASLHRELMRAVEAGLVERDDSRRPHEFRAASSSPMVEPLAALLRMTVGAEVAIAELLSELPAVEAAAIHGSWVEHRVRPSSDIDLLVVGDLDGRQLRSKLRRLGKALGREIDLTLVSQADFAQLVRSDNPFVRVVLERPRLDLIGDVGRLAKLHD